MKFCCQSLGLLRRITGEMIKDAKFHSSVKDLTAPSPVNQIDDLAVHLAHVPLRESVDGIRSEDSLRWTFPSRVCRCYRSGFTRRCV